MKKAFSLLLSLALCLALCIPAAAAAEAPSAPLAAAEKLHTLGLFKGAGYDQNGDPVYELDRTATRAEALVMLIRLMGKEQEALASTAQNPFTDVATWADRYVAYAYEQKWTNGIGGGLFGMNQTATAQMYTTFVLRALGYTDMGDQTDFTYAGAKDFAATLGLVTPAKGDFLRGDMAQLSLDALSQNVKGRSESLLEALMEESVFSAYAADAAGFDVELPRNGSTVQVSATKTGSTSWRVDSAALRKALSGAVTVANATLNANMEAATGMPAKTRALYEALYEIHTDQAYFSKLLSSDTVSFYDKIVYVFDQAGDTLAYFERSANNQADSVTLTICRTECSELWQEVSGSIESAIAACQKNTVTVDMDTVLGTEADGDTWHPIYLNGVSLEQLPKAYYLSGANYSDFGLSSLLSSAESYHAGIRDALFEVIWQPLLINEGKGWQEYRGPETALRVSDPTTPFLLFLRNQKGEFIGYVTNQMDTSYTFE